MKKCTMIINPNSGKRRKKINQKYVKKIFNNYGYVVDIIYTEYKGHALELTINSDSDLIISVGGDGTFNEVMRGNFKRQNKVLLSHIPTGTANDIGKMYGYSRSIYKNIKLVLSGVIKNTDICTINGTPFTYVAALGKFTNISYDTPRILKKKYGYLAYLIEGLKDLNKSFKSYDITYEIDNEEYSGKYTFILISSANRIAGINNFYHDIKLDDDNFEVLFCTLKDYREVIRSLYCLKKKDISQLNGFKFYKTNNLKINFKEKLSKGFSIDGEEFEDKNEQFEIVIKKNIKLLLPKKNIDKLFLDKE